MAGTVQIIYTYIFLKINICLYRVLIKNSSSEITIVFERHHRPYQQSNKINDFNNKGPLPQDTPMLVLWDVVAIFLNLDNNLGINAVRKILKTRANRVPSTECIVVTIVNFASTIIFNNMVLRWAQTGNACSYGNIAMGELDILAKERGPNKLNLWWRYRDDVTNDWTQDFEKLLAFTDYINALY